MNHPCALMLRQARVQEAQVMARMSRELIEAGLEWRYTPARMVALIGDADSTALVACDGPCIHGFAVMHFGDLHAHLTLLCVLAAQHRRGIGRRLHEWLVASARVAGMLSIGLELRADNANALAFYRALGFVETHLVPAYYDSRVAARRMTLRCSAAMV